MASRDTHDGPRSCSYSSRRAVLFVLFGGRGDLEEGYEQFVESCAGNFLGEIVRFWRRALCVAWTARMINSGVLSVLHMTTPNEAYRAQENKRGAYRSWYRRHSSVRCRIVHETSNCGGLHQMRLLRL